MATIRPLYGHNTATIRRYGHQLVNNWLAADKRPLLKCLLVAHEQSGHMLMKWPYPVAV